MHRVTVLAMEGFVIFDLAIAVDMFSRAKSRTGMDLYETYVCGDVAAGAGFSSASSFRDRFHRITGESPSAWRKTYRGLHNK